MRGAAVGLIFFLGCAGAEAPLSLSDTSQKAADPDPQFSISAANFINPVGGPGLLGVSTCGSSPDPACLTSPQTQIRWGTPAYDTDQSGLGFQNAQSAASSIVYDAVFDLGTLTHFNWPTVSGTHATGATLRLHLKVVPSLGGANIVDTDIDVPFTIDETSNYEDAQNPCLYPSEPGNPCADKITFGTTSFSIGSSTDTTIYDLLITGFVAPGTTTAVDSLISNESKSTSAVLQGYLREHCVDADANSVCDELEYCPCDDEWNNHGEYVTCVVKWSKEQERAGEMTSQERADLISEAAQSTCGQK